MTPQQLNAMKMALEALKNNKPTHRYCEDIWYSCPKHEDGCADEREGDECNCGADEINAEFDKAIPALEEALAEHAMRETQRLGQEIEQEPVCPDCKAKVFYECVACSSNNYPPQRTEQEPVAHWSDCSVHSEPAYPKGECDCGGIVAVADYTALSDKYVALKAQRKPLTDEQIDAACKAGKIYRIDFIRAYQAAHGIKENT